MRNWDSKSHCFLYKILTIPLCNEYLKKLSLLSRPSSDLNQSMILLDKVILLDQESRFAVLSRHEKYPQLSSGDPQDVERQVLHESYPTLLMLSFFISREYSRKKKMSSRLSQKHRETSRNDDKQFSFSMRSTDGANHNKMYSFLGWRSELSRSLVLQQRIRVLLWSMLFYPGLGRMFSSQLVQMISSSFLRRICRKYKKDIRKSNSLKDEVQ